LLHQAGAHCKPSAIARPCMALKATSNWFVPTIQIPM
jgi:hypothetical protein